MASEGGSTSTKGSSSLTKTSFYSRTSSIKSKKNNKVEETSEPLAEPLFYEIIPQEFNFKAVCTK